MNAVYNWPHISYTYLQGFVGLTFAGAMTLPQQSLVALTVLLLACHSYSKVSDAATTVSGRTDSAPVRVSHLLYAMHVRNGAGRPVFSC